MSGDPPVSKALPRSASSVARPGWPTRGAGLGPRYVTNSFLLAATAVFASGVVLFGWHAVRIGAVCLATSVAIHTLFYVLTGRRGRYRLRRYMLLGLLAACTLPPLVSWPVAVTAAGVTAVLSLIIVGPAGNHLWNPVALGRIAVQILFADAVTPDLWPVLRRGALLWGNLSHGGFLPPSIIWARAVPTKIVDAWLVHRPVDLLRSTITQEDATSSEGLMRLVRDSLPDWRETLWGTAGGGIGEACVLACLLAGLILLRRGLLRPMYVILSILAAGVCAAVLPVLVQSHQGLGFVWLPGLIRWHSVPVGLAYVVYQLTAGEWPLILLLIAPDPTSSPLTSRGYILFGVLMTVMTMVLRILVGIPASGYWALLIANTFVPVINRMIRRRRLEPSKSI